MGIEYPVRNLLESLYVKGEKHRIFKKHPIIGITTGIEEDKEYVMTNYKVRITEWMRDLLSSIREWLNPRKPVPVPVRNQNRRR